MFLLVQMFGIIVSYFFLYFFLPWLFRMPRAPLGRHALRSIALIAALIVVIFVVVFSIESEFWANRIQHAFGGAFVMMFVVFRAVKDSRLLIDPLRFLVIALLVTTACGVASELFEFFFHTLGYHEFADSIEDTWLDLLSNAIGATLGGIVFAPFISSKR